MGKVDSEIEFISDSRLIHGDFYDYSKVEYNGATGKVTIVCPIHGEFTQRPSSHRNGAGCKKCGDIERGRKKIIKARDSFESNAIRIHAGKYSYAKSIYLGTSKKLEIICYEHGPFWQTPNSHLSGAGCPKCGRKKASKNRRRIDTDVFISRSISVHGCRYDYSKSVYKKIHENLIVICNVHGEFLVTPHNHWSGKGCKECGIISRSESRRLSNEDFIEKARKIHGNYYGYSKCCYKTAKEKVIITCPVHGDIEIEAHPHINGRGCYKCHRSNGEKRVARALDNIGVEYIEQHRFPECRRKNPLPFDFFIPSHSLCIEFQGVQHFETTHNGFFGGEKALKKRMESDRIKKRFCKESDIQLLEIRYDEENIQSRIIQALNSRSARKFIDPQLKLFTCP